MSRLIRWEPFRESRRMHDMIDRFMDRTMLDSPFFAGWIEGIVPVDVMETDDDIVVKATIPGMKPEDLNISISGDTLSIRGEAQEEHEEKEVRYHLHERRMSRFSRSITLPTSVNAEKAVAEFEDGVLKLTLPKAEEVKPKTITVKAK
jgi:HSP20 family protein